MHIRTQTIRLFNAPGAYPGGVCVKAKMTKNKTTTKADEQNKCEKYRIREISPVGEESFY